MLYRLKLSLQIPRPPILSPGLSQWCCVCRIVTLKDREKKYSGFPQCSSLLSTAVINAMTKSNLWRKVTVSSDSLQLETYQGKLRKKLKWRPWKDTAYGLALYGLLCLHLYVYQDHFPGKGIIHSELGFPCQLPLND